MIDKKLTGLNDYVLCEMISSEKSESGLFMMGATYKGIKKAKTLESHPKLEKDTLVFYQNGDGIEIGRDQMLILYKSLVATVS